MDNIVGFDIDKNRLKQVFQFYIIRGSCFEILPRYLVFSVILYIQVLCRKIKKLLGVVSIEKRISYFN